MKTVVTTISTPTTCMITLAKKHNPVDRMIIIGDLKGPEKFILNNCEFYSLEAQNQLKLQLPQLLPTGHYSRKNVGYLIAMQKGEECIYETDDDNEPNEYWSIRSKQTKVLTAAKSSWINVYRHFSSENIWPRGFLLDMINQEDITDGGNNPLIEIEAPIQQGLADISPDVDAIWRLTCDREFHFERKASISLQKGSWCPFNTQSTWWWKEAFPLMYLPSNCSFRMTDIWKSFVAQRCLWEMDYQLVFHAAEVNQARNAHNLMKDFEAEIPGYMQNERLTHTLEETPLLAGKDNALFNLVLCYESLIAKKIIPAEEMKLVKAWAADVEKILY